MASPIVIDGTASIIPINTKLLPSPIVVNLPPLNLLSRLFTIVDTGGQADINPITINAIGGATIDGQLSIVINTKSASVSFSQSTDSIYLIAKTVIRGNILQGPPRIIISTMSTIISTITSQSSLVVYGDMAASNLVLGGNVFALGGFQPSLLDPYVSIDYLSAITISTKSISVGSIASGGGFNTSNIIGSSIFTSSLYKNTLINTTATAYAKSTFTGSIVLNGNILYSDNNDLYLGPYKINSDVNFLVPEFTSSIQGLVSTLVISPGLSSLSSFVGVLSSVYNPNPGLSTLSSYNASRVPFISGQDTSTLFGMVSSGLSSANNINGLSSLSTVISRGLSSIAIPFSLSTLLLNAQVGISSVYEGQTVSSLNVDLSRGLSTVNQNDGIDQLTINTRDQLSTTATSVLFSTISTNLGYGFSTINVSSYMSSIYQNASTSFSNADTAITISSFSSILEAIVFNVDTTQGLSSLSSVVGCGFSTIDIRAPVSSLSTSISQGLSSLVDFSIQISSLSTSITRQLSTLLDLGISSLSNDLSRGASTVFAGTGASSFSQYQSTSFFNMMANTGLSSLSTTLVLGLSTVITGITPSSQITFSSLSVSSISLLNNGLLYGSLIVDNNIFTVNGHAVTPPNNDFEYASSISTYSMFVGSTATSFVSLNPSSLNDTFSLTASSILTTALYAESTIVGTITIRDVVTNYVNDISATASGDILLNGSSLFMNENVGLSTLSTFIGPAMSTISSFADTINAISTGFSTLALAVPRISTLSSLYAYRIKESDISTGVSTIDSYISTLRVSSVSVKVMNMWSTFASTLNTSSLNANVVSSFLATRSGNSFIIASTVSAVESYVSSFAVGVQVSSMSTNSLTFGRLETTNILANSFFASTFRTNTAYGSTIFMQDRGARYTTTRPLEFSTFFPIYGSNGSLIYNSTSFATTGVDIALYSSNLSTNTFRISSLNAGVIYASSIQFTGKVQFDRLTVMQSTVTPYFVAIESGYASASGQWNNGRLYVSPDGITWSNVDTTGQLSWVGKTTNGIDGSRNYAGAVQPKLVWNGSYMLAYATSQLNPQANRPNDSENTLGMSYDGINWFNVTRRAPNQGNSPTPYGLTSIVWTGEYWIKTAATFDNSSIPTNEGGETMSRDGSNWSRMVWNIGDASQTNLILCNAFTNNAVTSGGLNDYNGYSLHYNGLSLISYSGIQTTSGIPNMFSYDLANTFPLTSNGTAGTDFTTQFGLTYSISTIPIPWSDGVSWWYPTSTPNGTIPGLYRMQCYKPGYNGSGSGQIDLQLSNINDSNSGIMRCFGVGFSLSNINADNTMSFCGNYNGHMHVHGRSPVYLQAASKTAIPSSVSLVYSYDGIYFFRSPSVQGIRGSVRSVVYADGKWVVGATGNITGLNNTSGAVNTGHTIWNSRDGLNWQPSQMIASQVSATGCNGQSNLQGVNNSNTDQHGGVANSALGGGIASIIYMSNMTPALDFNGVRIYNQPGGISWDKPSTREQAIMAYQSSLVLHNTIVIAGDNSVSSLVAGTNIRVGICNVNPSTTLDIGGVATVTAERLYTSSLYILPSTSTTMFSESFLPLSSFNLYVHGSTFMSRLAVNVPRPVTILDISGANALFRFQNMNTDATTKAYVTALTDTNAILGPAMMLNSTAMTLYYKSGNTAYKRAYGGSNFFTGQHASICLDLSGALVSSVLSTITTDDNGESVSSFQTLWTDYSGYLLSSADKGYMSIPNQNLRLWGSNAINITEAMPYTVITKNDKDPSVFGVVTNNANASYNEDGSFLLDSDPLWGNDLHGRVRVNSIGEGALWVTNINGPVDSGDYLCSSVIPGHARKQDEDAMYNFTVAKATMKCDFDLNSSNYRSEPIEYAGSTFVRAYIGVTYHCG